MALRALKKTVTTNKQESKPDDDIKAVEFISQGGSLASNEEKIDTNDDHRLTLRIPRWLLQKVDDKRKERVGSISRNLWILEQIEKATR